LFIYFYLFFNYFFINFFSLAGPGNPHPYVPGSLLKRRSWWRHPSIKRLLMRSRITCALRLQEILPPFARFARLVACMHASVSIHARAGSFVPRGLHEYLVQLSSDSTSIDGTRQEDTPFGDVKYGAVLFCDASGFTKLTVWQWLFRVTPCIPSDQS
jgi:hypothetical protein